MDAEKNKRIRVAILELLNTEYGSTIDKRRLRFALDKIGYTLLDHELDAHLKYLEEKGYVRCETREGFGFKIGWCALTADGWDLLDGHKHEKGIDEAL
jgi:repressor of nif and glnA expression